MLRTLRLIFVALALVCAGVFAAVYATTPTLKERVDRITFVSAAHADTLPKECVGAEASRPENREFCKEVAELEAAIADLDKAIEDLKETLEATKRITDDIEQRNKLELERLRAPKR